MCCYKFSVLPKSTITIQILYQLYALKMNCTYKITQKLLLNVQLPSKRETVKLMSSDPECRRLFEVLHIYRETYQEITSFKLKLLAARAVSQF
jgi:cyanate lyase